MNILNLTGCVVLMLTTIFTPAKAEQSMVCGRSFIQDDIFTGPSKIELAEAGKWEFRANGKLVVAAQVTAIEGGVSVIYSKTELSKVFFYTYSFDTSRCDSYGEASAVLNKRSQFPSEVGALTTGYSCTCQED